MSVGVALIGSGIFAKTEHLPAVLATSTLTLKAVYSRSLKSAQELVSSSPSLKVELYSSESGTNSDFAALLKRSDIHAVIIALPILAQPSFILSALKAGKHVLSEKPIAATISDAVSLLSTYHALPANTRPTWSVAENFRFLPSFLHARSAIASLGRILSIHVRIHSLVSPGGRYYETAWRKTPEYQGGFLLDGGVHFIAAVRLLLSATEEDDIVSVSALTRQLQAHLPPVDTMDALMTSGKGVKGTFAVSFGTTTNAYEFTVACEKGSVTVGRDVVTIREGQQKEGKETVKSFDGQGSGVGPEVDVWGQALSKGLATGKEGSVEIDGRQRPEEALKDLMILETMLLSGEDGGNAREVKTPS